MSFKSLFTILLTISVIVELSLAKCPKAEELAPCTCDTVGSSDFITCNRADKKVNFDIKKIFNQVSKDPEMVKTVFHQIIFHDIDDYPEDAIGSLKFEKIVILSSMGFVGSSNGSARAAPRGGSIHPKFHPNAFRSSAQVTNRFEVNFNFNKEDLNLTKTIFDCANSFPNLEEFQFNPEYNLTIPDKVFVKLPKLKTVRLENVFKIVGSPFYNLDNLESVIVWNTNYLTNVPASFLKFGNRTKDLTLLVTLMGNVENSGPTGRLTGESFEKGVFTGLNGPLRLNFNHNSIKYLKEDIFLPFFEANTHNYIINMEHNPLYCGDCKSFWIFDQPTKMHLEFRIEYAYCGGSSAQGNTIWDKKEKWRDCAH